MKRIVVVLAAAVALGAGVPAHSQYFNDEDCGALKNAYGPFDYRTGQAQLAVVDSNHFTPEVENLKRGENATIGGDLDYTLRASPNHHRALMSLTNYAVRMNTTKAPNMPRSVDCYFDRARRFAPD